MTRTPVWSALLTATAVAWLGCGGTAPGKSDADVKVPKLHDDLGDLHHPISTSSARAQRYFDQGLILTYGFNHEAAVDSYREAARLDPGCAMCFWGIALALGPNINAPMGPEAGAAAYEAVQKARELAGAATPVERAYIDALAKRYAADPKALRAPLDRAFAKAMGAVAMSHPDDLDASVIYAEALMDLTPWDYWTPDGKPRADTPEILATLDRVLDRNPDHPGANHYLIHALEEFDPRRAESAADRLAGFAPGAGHLVHMPSHIYWRVGRYADAVAINEKAAAADEAYFAACRAPGFYAAGYYTHNLHFLWSAASTEGQADKALTAARRLVANVPVEALAEIPFLEDFLAVPILTLARFGRWDAILAEPRPPEDQPYVTAMWRYARGLALARQGDTRAAETELRALAAAADDRELASRIFDVAGNTAGQRLAVARRHLAGEIAIARGKTRPGLAGLREAVRVQDSINYIEPPAFYFPVRQALGAALLDAGKAQEAESVYRRDLEQYPRNGWSLFGLAESLRGQGRDADARWVRRGFENAWARAEVELTRSAF